MIKTEKTYYLLEAKDIEERVSRLAGRSIKISDMDVELIDSLPVASL